jgi:hypothetical protein
MAKADQFRQYAEEAMRWAFQSKTEKEKQAYIDLARTWTQAAVHSEHIFGALPISGFLVQMTIRTGFRSCAEDPAASSAEQPYG